MKYTRITALAAIGVAATLSLTACNGDDGSAQDPATKAPSTASGSSSGSSSGGASSSQGSTGSTGSNSGSTSTGGGSKASSGSGNGGASGSGKIAFCKTQDLAIDARNAAPDKSTGTIDIVMMNRGSTTCSASGFAGVDIKDADHTSNPVERGHAEPRITTLKPGAAAIFNLSYVIDNSGKSLAHPTNILVTPPNETHTVTLNWPSGAGAIKGAYTDVQVYPTHNVE